MKTYSLLAASLASLPFTVWAESRPDNRIDDEVVVTATRNEQPLHKVLASVAVMNRVDIERSTATDMAGLLGQISGLDVKDSGSRGSTSSVNIRGTNSDHVLILIDGVRSASATSGATALQQIPLEQIERIEVVKGPRASLYGADALGGVIQVFTRRGFDNNGDVAIEVGADHLTKITSGFSGGTEHTRAAINLAYENTDGYDSTAADGSVNDDDDGYREKSLLLSLDHTFSNDWSLGFSGLRVESEAEFDGGDGAYTDSVNQTLALSLQAPLSEQLSVSVNLSENRDESETFSDNNSEFNTQRHMATAQVDYALNASNLVSLGYDYYEDEVTSTTAFSEDARDNQAYFLQYQGEIQQWLLTASLRSDDNQAFGRHTTRTLAVGYPITDHTLLSVSYGTAFKAPTFNDLYYPYQQFNFGAFLYEYSGNAELEPERSESVEVLLRSVWRGVQWSLSYYQTDIDDLIDLGYIGTVNTPINVSEATVDGAEFSADFRVLGWNSSLAMAYTDPRNEDTDAMLADRSRGSISWSLDKQFGDWEVFALWRAQSYRYNSDSERLGGFNTVDLRATYQLLPQLQLTTKVSNLFDVDYTLNSNAYTVYETPGRQWSIGARYQF